MRRRIYRERIKNVTHPPIDDQITFLHTQDLSRTARFYEEVLGLPLVVDQGDCRIYRTSPQGYLGFCRRPAAPQEPMGVILTLVTSEVDAWYQYLLQRGVAFERRPELNPKYDIYHCFLRDPNGYLIEIQRFNDPAWKEPLAGAD
jgi:catechol 2,3-dioxygenase-like lactoylglutathione lyase family enzyme